MRWSPLGKIFDPRDFQLPLRCVEFAQAPQALVLEDRVRVYFSSRSVDSPGNFISHICFVDFSLDWRSIIAVSEEQVVPNGELGTFDEHGTFPMNILATEDVVYGFTTGWSRRVSVSVDTAIGLVVSKDGGNSFKKLGPGPILGPTKTEPFLVADGCVVRDTGAFHMWYIFGSHWIAGARDGVPERVYKIAHAESHDLVNWKRNGEQIIDDVLGPNECQALPTVFRYKNQNHMIFAFRPHRGFRVPGNRSYDLGYASSDGFSLWTREDARGGLDFARSDWDNEMRSYPSVVSVGEKLFLLYNGNQFGRYGFGLAELVE